MAMMFRRREPTYELSLAVWIPGIKLPFRLRITTGDVKLLWSRVRCFRREIRNRMGKA